MVFMVPRLIDPSAINASSSRTPPGSASLSARARQSVGTTSNPTPGNTTIPARRASPSRALQASNTAISPVMSR